MKKLSLAIFGGAFLVAGAFSGSVVLANEITCVPPGKVAIHGPKKTGKLHKKVSSTLSSYSKASDHKRRPSKKHVCFTSRSHVMGEEATGVKLKSMKKMQIQEQ